MKMHRYSSIPARVLLFILICTIDPLLAETHLIISTNKFRPVAQQFIQYRDAYEKVRSKFISIEDIKSHSAKASTKPTQSGWATLQPKKIKIKNYDFELALKITGFLAEYSKENTVGSVMVIGDAAIVPPSYYFFDDYDIGDPYYRQYSSWIPSDLYYGSPDLDLQYDWPVGRISVDTPEQAAIYIEKVTQWRKDRDLQNIPPAVYFGGNVTRNFLYFGEVFYDILQERGLLGPNPLVHLESAHQFGTGLGIHVIRKVPASLMWVFSHGMGDGFVFKDFPVLAQMIEQAPYKKGLPLILSPSCMDGGYDYDLIDVPFDVDELSIGEAILRSPGAGIGYIGGSRVNLTDGDITFSNGRIKIDKPGYMPAILIEFLEAYSAGSRRVGDAFLKSYHKYYKDRGVAKPGDLATYASYILMADPTIQMPALERQQVPKTDVIQFIGEYTLSTDQIPVYQSNVGAIEIRKHKEAPSSDYTVRIIDALNKKTLLNFYPLSQKAGVTFHPPKDSLYFAAVENARGEVSWHYFWVGKSKTVEELLS